MKIGVSSYSFAAYLGDGRLDLFGVIKKAAEIGFDGIEFSGIGMPADSPAALPLARKVKDACAAAGLPVIGYPVGADFLSARGGWQAEVERLKGEVKVAAELGAPVMRHDATRGFPEGHEGPKDFGVRRRTRRQNVRREPRVLRAGQRTVRTAHAGGRPR